MKYISILLLLFATTVQAAYVQTPYSIANGGTNSTAALSNNRVMKSSGGAIVEAAAITAAFALISDANGIPVASSVSSTTLGFLDATSSIQTQINGKQAAFTGTTLQYVRGDGSLATLNTSVVPESGSLYFTNARAIAATLTAYSAGAGTVSSSDSILSALQKIDGNDALKLPSASFTDTAVTGKLLTGYTSGAGMISSSDSILSAIQKLNGNIAALPGANMVIVNGGDASYTIQTGDQHVRSGTTLTANRTYTLPACSGGNIGERHEVKNIATQTFNVILAPNGTDKIDNDSSETLVPGDSFPVVCAVAGVWEIQ